MRQNYRVEIPAVTDIEQYGTYIAGSCHVYATYELARVEHHGKGEGSYIPDCTTSSHIISYVLKPFSTIQVHSL